MDKFQIEYSKALAKYRQDLKDMGLLSTLGKSENQIDEELHARFIALWAGSPEMDWCELEDVYKSPGSYTGYYVWCSDHSMPASHCGTDGDIPVCVVHAQASGCNCCPINYEEELRAEVKARFGNRISQPTDEEELELHHRVRAVLNDRFGMYQNDAQVLIDDLRNAGISFRVIKEK